MTYGDPHHRLLKAIIDVVRTRRPDAVFYSIDVTEALLRKNYWGSRPLKTPERTANMYCSQNPQVFEHVGSDTYKLRPNGR